MSATPVMRFSGVVLWKEDLVLLQKRSFQAKLLPGRWGVFGGHIEDGESPIQTAVREIEEELSVSLDPNQRRELCTLRVQRMNALYVAHYYSSRIPVSLKDMSLREGIGFSLWSMDEIPQLHLAHEDFTAVQTHFGS